MDKIASFQINHEKLEPGLYVSRADEFGGQTITTFDIRCTRPNHERPMSQAVMHTIEHLGATFLRNNPEWKDKIVYFGPMGCNTGFYLIIAGEYQNSCDGPFDERIYWLVLDMCHFIATHTGSIPGVSPKECGNWRKHNLPAARNRARDYMEELIKNKNFTYPT